MGTKFSSIYERFLGKVTDDMYMELTPADTLKMLQSMLINSLPNFEFPKINLYAYHLDQQTISKNDIEPGNFIISTDNEADPPTAIIDNSSFEANLTPEEQNILAILMLIEWTQAQINSVENTRMKYSGSDFKMTSQANHLQKLLALLNESQKISRHDQRLYKRRKLNADGTYSSNWSIFNTYDN